MIEITLEEIQKKFEELPEDLRWAIMAANVDEKVTDIGQANGLNIDQMGQLSVETHMVILGLVQPEKFEESLKGSLNLPDEKNKKIMQEVNEKILKEIRDFMQKSGKESEENESEILNKAGIEITENPKREEVKEPAKDGLESEMENRDDMLNKLENPDLINKGVEEEKKIKSISAQKLSTSFKMAGTQTEYSLSNMSKPGTPTPPAPSVSKDIAPPKIDPYREAPGE